MVKCLGVKCSDVCNFEIHQIVRWTGRKIEGWVDGQTHDEANTAKCSL